MGITFRGGELVQKGNGLGGFFRGLIHLFKPTLKRLGQSAVKTITSDTAKNIARHLGTQALDSTLNLTKDMILGNDMKQSFQRERQQFKETGAKLFKKRKRNTTKPSVPSKKRRRVTLKTMRRYEPL